MSLYRKYRPRTFADVVNQAHIVGTLQNASAQGTMAHAYLFAGPRGTGKTSVARIVAKEMLTQKMTDEKLKEQIRTAVDDGTLVDLVEIDAASNRGIDDIRTLVEKIQFSPVAAAAKVYIIDEVHMLTREAFNALLKTLEEPPPYAFFILATTELQKIPPTIQSRCQRFAFRQVSEDDMIGRLQFIADREQIAIDRPSLQAVARHAQGGLRDAISLLDQLRSLGTITLPDVEQKIGASSQEDVDAILQAIDESTLQTIVDRIRTLERSGTSLDAFARQLLSEVRRRMHVALESGQPIHSFLALSAQLLNAIRDMRLSPVPALALESALLSMHASGVETPVAKSPPPTPAKAIKKEVPVAGKAAVEPVPASTPIAPAGSGLIEAPDLTLQVVRDSWGKMLETLGTPAVRMSLKAGRPTSVRGNVITITFSAAFNRDRVRQTDASREVEEILTQMLRQAVRIECILEEDAGAKTMAAEDLVNLAEAAAEVF